MSIEGWAVENISGQVALSSIYSSNEGVKIYINKKRKSITVTSWFDSICGTRCIELKLDDLLNLFMRSPRKKKVNDTRKT